MNDTNKGKPAFPTMLYEYGGGSDGMTLRDYFAAKAMQGLITGGSTNAQEIGEAAFIVADAMLKAREV